MSTTMPSGFARFVAIGDSITEGLNDGDETSGYVGWADRLAVHLARLNPSLRYANLAVRGLRTPAIRATQLDAALALDPDLVSVVTGTNDILHGTSIPVLIDQIEEMFVAARKLGSTVMTMTVPELSRHLPLARLVRHRVWEFNRRLLSIASRHGVITLDVDLPRLVDDPRVWSADRMHASTYGHTVVAAMAADLFGVPPVGWIPAETVTWPRLRMHQRARLEASWILTEYGPWLWRRVTGHSSGDGKHAKHSALVPVLTGAPTLTETPTLTE